MNRHEKILKYASELSDKNPERWAGFLDVVVKYQGNFSPEETAKRARKVVENWFKPEKNLIPNAVQWNRKESVHDCACHKCELLDEPGIMRYLGSFYAGTEKVCVEKLDEYGEPYFTDVEFANYLDGWRCDVCGQEETDGY